MICISHYLDIKNKITKSFTLIQFISTIFLCGCSGTFVEKNEEPKNLSKKKLILINLYPKNKETSVKRNSKIILNFNNSLIPSTLTVNTENSLCSGTIQITTNNFKTCVIMNLAFLIKKNKTVILIPKGIYAANHYHKIRLTKGIKAKNGTTLNKDLITIPGFKTAWSQQIGTKGNDTGFAVSVDKEENIYIAGLTSANERNDQKDLFLVKYLPSSFQQWIKQPGFDRQVIDAVLQTKKNGQIILSAYAKEQNNSSVIIASYDMDGKKIFSKTIKLTGISSGEGITMDKEGHVYVTSATPFNILKIGSKGRIIWGSELDKRLNISGLAVDKGNGLYITGNIKKSLEDTDRKGSNEIFLLKISKMGPKLWSKTFKSSSNVIVNSIAINSDKNVAIAGYIKQSEIDKDFGDETKDAFVAKYNSEGEIQWKHIFNGKNSEQSTYAHWTPKGSLLIGGFTESNLEGELHIGKEDGFLAKFKNDGELLWFKQFGTEENERLFGIALGKKEQIYVTGFSEGQMDGAKYYGGRDIFLVKFDKDGNKL